MLKAGQKLRKAKIPEEVVQALERVNAALSGMISERDEEIESAIEEHTEKKFLKL